MVEDGGEVRGTNALGHDDGADHAGAQLAVLVWGDEVFGHVGGGVLLVVLEKRIGGGWGG